MQPNRRTPQVVIEEITESGSEEEFGSPMAEVDAAQAAESSSFADKEQGAPSASKAEEASTSASTSNGHGDSSSSQQQEGAVTNGPAPLTEEEEANLMEAEALKTEGNALYGASQYQEALDKYRKALELAPEGATQKRAVYYANAAAVCLKLEQYADAAKDCSACLTLEPPQQLQVKALTRRSLAYEELKDLERAFADYEKIVELEPSNRDAQAAVRRLRPIVEEQREKMKEEMMGKLKELGNTVLGKFGLSLDNFKAVQDPQTGSYSINFSQ